MPENLTEVDDYTANVAVPVGSDTRNAASVRTPFQALANRTKHLHNLVEVPGARTIVLPMVGFPIGDDIDVNTALGTLVIHMFGGRFSQIIELPDGATLTAITARIQQGHAGAGGQMSASVYRQSAAGTVQLGSTLTFPDSTAVQTGVITIPPEVIDNSLNRYHMHVVASSLSVTLGDWYYGAGATVTDPRAGIKR